MTVYRNFLGNRYKPGTKPVSGLQDSSLDSLNLTGQPSREAMPSLKQVPMGPWSPEAKPSLNMELTRLTLSSNYTGSRALRAQACLFTHDLMRHPVFYKASPHDLITPLLWLCPYYPPLREQTPHA